MGDVYLRDIRSDGFALFFASLLGEEGKEGRGSDLWHSFRVDSLFCLSDDGGLGSQWVHYGSCIETIAVPQASGILLTQGGMICTL